jgi:hypothetical protein
MIPFYCRPPLLASPTWTVRLVLCFIAFFSLSATTWIEAAARPPARQTIPVIQAGPLQISERARDLIVHYECGGEAYYRQRLTRPTWPGGASGVTVGIGSDLGYITRAQIAEQWAHLGPSRVASLQTVAGIKGQTARGAVGRVRHVVISWEEALIHFEKSTLPRWGRLTASAFAGLEKAHPHCQGTLKSIAFNRGTSMTGDTRREMRQCRDAYAAFNRSGRIDDVAGVSQYILSMRRLWVGKGLDGLLKRRVAEAALHDAGIEEWRRHGNQLPSR